MDRRLMDFNEMLLNELGEAVQGGKMTPEMICNADKVVDMIADIEKMKYGEQMTEEYLRGYSQRGSYGGGSYGSRGRDGDGDGRYNEGRSSRGGSYGNGGSYRGGSYEVMPYSQSYTGGNYSNDGSYNGSYDNGGGYSGNYSNNGSYNGGYSRHDEKEAMIADLERAMKQASTEKDRENIRNLIEKMRR